MGRFFQTAPTQFTQDFIYQPPWELMQQAAAKKQQTYDAAIATSKLFDSIPMEHLQGEDDVYNVKEKQRYYAESANNIAKAIQNDPSKAGQYMSNLEALGKELTMDMKQGDLSKISASASSYKKWQEDNKERLKDDPARYAQAERAYLGRYQQAGGNSLSQAFKGDLVTKDVDWNKLFDSVDKIKANEYSQESAGASGGYIYKNKQTGEVVTKERIRDHIVSRLLTDPSNIAALRQSQDIGMGKYFNDETGGIDLTQSGFAGILGYSQANAYSKATSSNDMSSDGTYNAAASRAQSERHYNTTRADNNYKWQVEQDQKAEEKANKGKLTLKEEYAMRMDILEEPDENIKAAKQQEYNNIMGVNFNNAITKKQSYTDVFSAVGNQNLPGVGTVVGLARDNARKNTKMNPVERELAMYIDGKIAEGKIKSQDDIENATKQFIVQKDMMPRTIESGPYANYVISQKVNPYANFAKNYVDKQNAFIKDKANTAQSQKIFEVPSVASSQQASRIITDNPNDFVFMPKGGKPVNLNAAFKSDIGGLKNLKVNGVTSGQSYGSIGLEVNANGVEGYILPTASGNGSVSTQTLTNVMMSGLNSNSNIRRSLGSQRTSELQQAESGAKVKERGNSVFQYKTGGKDYRITKQQNGSYDVFNSQGNKLNGEVPLIDMEALSHVIGLDTTK